MLPASVSARFHVSLRIYSNNAAEVNALCGRLALVARQIMCSTPGVFQTVLHSSSEAAPDHHHLATMQNVQQAEEAQYVPLSGSSRCPLCAGKGVEAPAREKAVLGKAGTARNVPVGMPIHNTAVFLLPWGESGEQVSRDWSPCEEGEVQFARQGDLGEVCIAGACVSGGYLG
jgi:hypothetical protein